MELIGLFFLAVLRIFGAAASRQLADEFKAWTPRLVDVIIRRAVRQLPENQRERFAEEWPSHVGQIPGEVGKLIATFGFLSASWKMGDSDDHAKLGKKIVVEIKEIVEVEEELAALPPVGCRSNILMSNIFMSWMSNDDDDAVIATFLFRHRQQAAISAAHLSSPPLPLLLAASPALPPAGG